MLDLDCPWITADDVESRLGFRTLPVNVYVLELVHERLLTFYNCIDFDRVRQRTAARSGGGTERELDDVTAALSCKNLAATDELDIEKPPSERSFSNRHQRPLRIHRLFKVLERHLGCEIRQGKGSEIVVYRPGGKIFTFGHHKADAEVSWLVVQRMLKQVGISGKEWLAAISR